MKTLLTVVALSVALVGCGPNQTRPVTHDYSKTPANAEEQAKSYIGSQLRDETSARWLFGAPSVRECRGFLASKLNLKVYVLPVSVNAKNAFGAYTGYKSGYVLFANGQPMEKIQYLGKSFVTCYGVYQYAKKAG
jgi:hypothetical protein